MTPQSYKLSSKTLLALNPEPLNPDLGLQGGASLSRSPSDRSLLTAFALAAGATAAASRLAFRPEKGEMTLKGPSRV